PIDVSSPTPSTSRWSFECVFARAFLLRLSCRCSKGLDWAHQAWRVQDGHTVICHDSSFVGPPSALLSGRNSAQPTPLRCKPPRRDLCQREGGRWPAPDTLAGPQTKSIPDAGRHRSDLGRRFPSHV